jgi:hypothetical protein
LQPFWRLRWPVDPDIGRVAAAKAEDCWTTMTIADHVASPRNLAAEKMRVTASSVPIAVASLAPKVPREDLLAQGALAEMNTNHPDAADPKGEAAVETKRKTSKTTLEGTWISVYVSPIGQHPVDDALLLWFLWILSCDEYCFYNTQKHRRLNKKYIISWWTSCSSDPV